MRKHPLKLLALATLTFFYVVTAFGQESSKNKKQIQIVGTVIARWTGGGTRVFPSGVTFPEYVVVRVEESNDTLRFGQYIQVRYRYSDKEEDSLPKDFYTQKTQWQFTLERNEGAKPLLRDEIYSKDDLDENGKPDLRVEFVADAENDYLSLDEVIELYDAKLGSIKKK